MEKDIKLSLKSLGTNLILTNELSLWYVPHSLNPKEICCFLRLVCKDISDGQEIIPIPVTNLIDDSPVAPEGES